jgi:hypothetical protein
MAYAPAIGVSQPRGLAPRSRHAIPAPRVAAAWLLAVAVGAGVVVMVLSAPWRVNVTSGPTAFGASSAVDSVHAAAIERAPAAPTVYRLRRIACGAGTKADRGRTCYAP